MVPVRRTDFPTFRIHFQPAFLKPLFSPVVSAVVPLCKWATYSLPFQCLKILLPLVFIFPTLCKSSTCTIWLRRDRLSSIFQVIHIRLCNQPRQSLLSFPFWRLVCLFEASSLCPPVLPYLLLSRTPLLVLFDLPSFPAGPVIPSSLLAMCKKMDNFLAFWSPAELDEEIMDFGYLS